MIEIIKRREGEPSQKEQVTGEMMQVSYNSWGHLVVRVIQGDTQDVLVVFNKQVSENIIQFCQGQLTRSCGDTPF
jgi:hypothetical protein